VHDVPLDDSLYSRIQHAAASSGVSEETFVAEAVKVYLSEEETDEYPPLTPEQLAKVRAAQAQVNAGDVHTPEEVRAYLKHKHESWPADSRS